MFIQEILRATMGMAQPENAKKGIDFSWGKKNINNVKMHSASLQKFSFLSQLKVSATAKPSLCILSF